MARECVFASGADFEAAARSAAGSTAIAPVHASKCEPREAEKGKRDYCADLVQGVFNLTVRPEFSVVLGRREASGLALYIS
jgi:hypothetical protein